MKTKQIIALGGGGFSMEPRNARLDRYILEQARARRPKICFIPTASGDLESYIERFYRGFKKHECQPSHLSLFKATIKNMEQHLLKQDIIFVGGGNTRNLMVLWKEWGIDNILHKAYDKGVILSGVSAGSICWFQYGLTDSNPGQLAPLKCLGFLKGSNCPHYSNESGRRSKFKTHIRARTLLPGTAADDSCALHYVDGKLAHVVASRKECHGYKVDIEGETCLEARLLL